MQDRKNGDWSRRKVLQSVGAGGGVALAPGLVGASNDGKLTNVTERGTREPTTADKERIVTLRSTERSRYKFSVTGGLDVNRGPDKSIENGTISTSIESEIHEFAFNGEFTKFDIEGDIDVRVDGEPFDPESFPHKSLTIVAPQGTQIDISASGRIEATKDENGLSRINARRLIGETDGRTTFKYTGEITYFESKEEVLRVRKNGELISPEEILPSAFPSEVHISGAKESVTVSTSGDATVADGQADIIEDGVIATQPNSSEVVARYDGNIKQIEHELGGTIEFVPSNMRLVCSAPETESMEFGAEATGGLVHDRNTASEMKISVEAGESKQIKYYGDVSGLSIGGVALTIKPETDKEAIKSAKLQQAARFERTGEYETVAAHIDGRIRHDAKSLYYRSTTGGGANTLCVFQIDDADYGDYGVINIVASDESDEVMFAGYDMVWEADDGYPQKWQVNQLTGFTEGIETRNTFETRTFERGERVPEGQARADGGTGVNVFEGHDKVGSNPTASPDIIPDPPSPPSPPSLPSLPSLPSPGDILDYFGSALNSVASDIGIASETLAEITSDGIEAAAEEISDAADDIVFEAGVMIIDSQKLLIELVAAANDQLPRARFWDFLRRATPNFVSTVLDLAEVGVFEELADHNFGCAGCLAIIALTAAVGVSATATTICLAAGLSMIFAAACGFFIAEVIGLIDDYYEISLTAAEGLCQEVPLVC